MPCEKLSFQPISLKAFWVNFRVKSLDRNACYGSVKPLVISCHGNNMIFMNVYCKRLKSILRLLRM